MTAAKRYRPLLLWLMLSGSILGSAAVLSAEEKLTRLVITEFCASNVETLTDEDGDTPDWIELTNFSDERINLSQYCLTDSRLNPKKFRLPSHTVAPGERLLVLASGKTRESFSPPFHAPFRLSSRGEYLALASNETGDVLQAFEPSYPEQIPGLSYGIPGGAEALGKQLDAVSFVILSHPTPGAPNSERRTTEAVAVPVANPPRGLYTQTIEIDLSTNTDPAHIRFTIDGSEPSAAKGTLYTGPIPISQTTILRAVAIKEDQLSEVSTFTYLFPKDVITQRRPRGFPDRWADTPADYAMDPRITGDPAHKDQIVPALNSLPSLSIVSDLDHLFDKDQGIYSNPRQSGKDWERPVSIEWLQADRNRQVDAGLRIQGGWFRGPNVTRKHSFRIRFKQKYGPAKWRYDVFEEFGAADEFETLILRAGGNDGYAWRDAAGTAQYIRDEFGRRTLIAMGHVAPRGRFVHLYLNGCYWGLYNLCERPDENFSATYFGGLSHHWDAINTGVAKNGTLDAWTRATLTAGKVSDLAEYFAIQGKDKEGQPNPAHRGFFDIDHYIDYLLANMWVGNADWPDKNYWIGWDQSAASGAFRFYPWDMEITLGNNRARSPLDHLSPHPDTLRSGASEPHFWFRTIPEYKSRFSDRIQTHFKPGGALSSESVKRRYSDLAKQVELSIIAESARWGDDQSETPQTLEIWQKEKDWILNTYIPQRGSIVLKQLRKAGLYPKIHAPLVRTDPDDDSQLKLASVSGDIYYTLDGTDPRQPGGEIHTKAQKLAFEHSRPLADRYTLIAEESIWRYVSENLPATPSWTPELLSPKTPWKLGFAPLGAGTKKVKTTLSRSLPEGGKSDSSPHILKKTFGLPVLPPISELVLNIHCSDAVTLFLNGTAIYRSRDAPAAGTDSPFSTAARENDQATQKILADDGLLRQGQNTLLAFVFQRSASDSETRFDLSLTARTHPDTAIIQTGTIPLEAFGTLMARVKSRDRWSALVEQDFTVSIPIPEREDILISEISFAPEIPATATEKTVAEDARDFEYVAITNRSQAPYNISRMRISKGIEFQFPRNTILPPQSTFYVVRNTPAFESRFGTTRTIAGQFTGRLKDSGEIIRLSSERGTIVDEVHYRTKAPWPIVRSERGFVLRRVEGLSATESNRAKIWEKVAESSLTQ